MYKMINDILFIIQLRINQLGDLDLSMSKNWAFKCLVTCCYQYKSFMNWYNTA